MWLNNRATNRCILLFEFLIYFLLILPAQSNQTFNSSNATTNKNEYWVRPDTVLECPHKVSQAQCVTITDLVETRLKYSRILFLAGVHVPKREGWMDIEFIGEITVQGQQKVTTIDCSLGMNIGFLISRFQSLTLSNISLLSCGLRLQSYQINATVMIITSFNTCNLNITDVKITKSKGSGLHIRSVCTSGCAVRLYILNCNIKRSTMGGHVHILIEHPQNVYSFSSLLIENSLFLDGYGNCQDDIIRYPFSHCSSGGVTIQTKTYSVLDVMIRNCTFKNNEAVVGGGLLLTANVPIRETRLVPAETLFGASPKYKITIKVISSVFFNNTAEAHGGGIAIAWKDYNSDDEYIDRLTIDICFSNTILKQNRANKNGGALYTQIPIETPNTFKLHRLYNCTIESNMAVGGLALYTNNDLGWTIKNSIFTGNRQLTQKDSTETGVIDAQNVKEYISVNEVTIRDNTARGLYLHSTTLVFNGINTIENNYAKSSDGGGILFDCSTKISKSAQVKELNTELLLERNSHLQIIANRADEYGGGIAIGDGCNDNNDCFFSIITGAHTDNMITFVNNSAKLGGYSIYGGHLENCASFFAMVNVAEMSIPSAVSSLPYRVCICDLSFPLNHKCSQQLTISAYPGQEFKVPIVCVGQFNHSSACIVQVELSSSSRVHVPDSETLRQLGVECTNQSYPVQVFSTQINVSLYLTVKDSRLEYDSRPNIIPTEITVWIKACPPGFTQAVLTGKCVCTSSFDGRGVICNIKDERIYKTSSMWVGNYSGEVTVHQHCPLDYCKVNFTAVNPYNQQEQCAFRRSGVLCGACRPGLSLVLGTSQCKECSNIYLLLLIPFTVAGVVVVVLLLKCNLTVSTGTINGLIFYANIVRATQTAFFPAGSNNTLIHILSVFVAWLNLDLGIETCLFDGLNTYYRTWLQFVFPLYIWTLVGLLIIVSRYSIKVSRWTGSNTVSVLATLFLLSYAKLLRTTFDILTPTSLTDARDNETFVWLVNGNYQFLQWPHSLLFAAALVTLLLHILPFTFLVLTAPILQRYSHHMPLRWVNKLMPLFDAYQGPYKAKARYYTGLLLLVRLVILSAVALNVSGNQSVNLFVLSITIGVVLVLTALYARKLYRKKLLIMFELFFLGNLLLLIMASQFLHSNEQLKTNGQSALIICMVGSAFAASVGIVLYHLYLLCLKIDAVKRFKTRVASLIKRPKEEDEDGIIETTVNPPQSRAPTTTVVELKEALLASDDCL